MKKESFLERKALVAKKRIESISESLKDINRKLDIIYNTFDDSINGYPLTSTVAKTEDKENPDYHILKKIRNKLDFTKILMFKMHGIYFYIEFTIRNAKNESNMEGCFIYGTSYFNEKEKVVDKPIVCFSIDNDDIIVSDNDFENESWINNKENLLDIHIRALDKIWKDGFYEINNEKF